MPEKRGLKWLLFGGTTLMLIITMVLSISYFTGVFKSKFKSVVIYDEENIIEVKTLKSTVSEVLEQANITIGPNDEINVDINELISESTREIYIDRAKQVVIYSDGETKSVYTLKNTVDEVLSENNITLTNMDRVIDVDGKDPVIENMNISIVRIDDQLEYEEITIPYESERKANSLLYEGVENLTIKGQTGTRLKTYRILYEDGVESGRELVNDIIVKNPVTEVTEYGTKVKPTPTPKVTPKPSTSTNQGSGGSTTRGLKVSYTQSYTMKASAYTTSYEDTGKKPGDKYYGITASGMTAQVGVIAVDKSVIPLGTKMYVESLDSTKDYGYCIAGDTGGGIKGSRVDLYYNTRNECIIFGVRNVRVYILEDQSLDVFKLRG